MASMMFTAEELSVPFLKRVRAPREPEWRDWFAAIAGGFAPNQTTGRSRGREGG